MRNVWKLHRRQVLRGAGGAALALPLLDAMTARRAEAQTTPRRLIILFNAGGTYWPDWLPKGTETSWELSPILQPLEAFKSKMIVLDNVAQKGMMPSGRVDAHESGMGGFLTGQPLQTGPFSGANLEKVGYPTGISVDQAIAHQLRDKLTTKFKTLEFGVDAGGSLAVAAVMSYSALNQPQPAERDPWKMFARLFNDLDPNSPEVMRRRAERRTLLDAARRDLGNLQAKVGADDRRRLEAHFQGLRELERRLDGAQAFAASACAKPTLPPAPVTTSLSKLISSNENYPILTTIQMDLMAMALACDLTRIASLQWHGAASSKVFTFLDIPRFHHDWSHTPEKDLDGWQKMSTIHRWYAEQVAYLCKRLDAISEGPRKVLDNTVVFWGNEFGWGLPHQLSPTPYVLIGSCGGYFKTGRYLRYGTPPPVSFSRRNPDRGAPPHNKLLVSLMNAMGVPVTTFGKAEWCQPEGPLPGLAA